MAFLCPSRSGRSKEKKQKASHLGRITGSASIDTLVRVGLEKQHGLKLDSRMVATHDFLPCAQNELKLLKGEEAYLLYKENEWAYVLTEQGQEGFVPNSFLIPYNVFKRRSVLSSHSNDFTMWEIEDESDLDNLDEENGKTDDIDFSCNKSEEFMKNSTDQYVVLYDFQIVNDNDINVSRGEVVILLNSDDTDWSWIVKSNKQEGFIPSLFICLLPKELEPIEILKTSSEPSSTEPPPLPPKDYEPLKKKNSTGINGNLSRKTIDCTNSVNKKIADNTSNLGRKTTDNTSNLGRKTTDNTSNLGRKTIDNTSNHSRKTTDNTGNLSRKTIDNTSKLSRKTTDNTSNLSRKTTDNTSNLSRKTTDNTSNLGRKTTDNTSNHSRKTTDNTGNLSRKTTDNTSNHSRKTTDNTSNLSRKTADSTESLTHTSDGNITVETIDNLTRKTVDITSCLTKKTTDSTNNLTWKTSDNTGNLTWKTTNSNGSFPGKTKLDSGKNVQRDDQCDHNIQNGYHNNFTIPEVKINESQHQQLTIPNPQTRLNRTQSNPRSPDYVKMIVSTDYCSPTEPYISVKEGEVVFIDYNNQKNASWLWVYSPLCNMYGSIPSSLLKQPHEKNQHFSNMALV